MAKKAGVVEYGRLRSLLIQDKVSTPTQVAALIKSEVYAVLGNYMELFADDLDVLIDCDERGFHVVIDAHTLRFKALGVSTPPNSEP